MSHDVYVALAYGVTAIVIAALILWVVLDQRARRAELSELEARGVRRRSAAAPASGTDHGG